MPPQQWASAAEMAERVGQSITVSERAVEEAEMRLRAAAQERAQLATEVEALSTLRRQQVEKWQYEAAKADQNQLDELVQQRWQAAQAQAAPAVALFQAEPAA
jgi:flagellar protein FliJ